MKTKIILTNITSKIFLKHAIIVTVQLFYNYFLYIGLPRTLGPPCIRKFSNCFKQLSDGYIVLTVFK